MDRNAKRARPLVPWDDQRDSESGRLTSRSLARAISPPRKKPCLSDAARGVETDGGLEAIADAGTNAGTTAGARHAADAISERSHSIPKGKHVPETGAQQPHPQQKQPKTDATRFIRSPFRLTWIRDLNDLVNVDAVTLRDVIGDPLISECWNFNYLHDIEFLLSGFDEDTRSLVRVHIVHGFWKKDDANRITLQNEASRHKNVTLHGAFMPEMFGTHHSKMLILLRHDDTAQVVIHTANMIPKDWTNMTNGVWLSPLLPLLRGGSRDVDDRGEDAPPAQGGGRRFKADLLNYLGAYNARRDTCRSLVGELQRYDFASVRGTLIASVPGRHRPPSGDPSATLWGWPAMKKALQSVPVQAGAARPEIVVQVSSIATLGQTDVWLRRTLFDALSRGKKKDEGLTGSKHVGGGGGTASESPEFKVVFPTADEIRRSLDGYASGGSIHTKIQSAQQAKQLLYLRPIFCHWANNAPDRKKRAEGVLVHDAGRKRASPHIKTYIRYGRGHSVDWALMTSANLSKQAWGEAANQAGEVRIASWEIGVLVWPALFAANDDACMTPVFKTDLPTEGGRGLEQEAGGEEDGQDSGRIVVGLRVPYNLPLQGYGKDEVPWVATASYSEPDWMGNVWDRWNG